MTTEVTRHLLYATLRRIGKSVDSKHTVNDWWADQVVGRRVMTGFPSIDEMVRADYDHGLTITGNARYEILAHLMDQWGETEKIGVWKPVDGWDDMPYGTILVADLGTSEPPDGAIKRLWDHTREQRFLVLVGDNRIEDAFFDSASWATIQFDWDANDSKQITWKISYAREGEKMEGVLQSSWGRRPKWQEAVELTRKTGILFAL